MVTERLILDDEFDPDTTASVLGAPRVVHFTSVGSTMDEAHRLAESGVPSGTVIVADEQTSGRGRLGRRWISGRGAGLWLTTIHRGIAMSGLDVLSLRVGLSVAPALDRFAGGLVTLKWPNDLFIAERKLGGILVETRWRDTRVEYVAVGMGINICVPDGQPGAVGLEPGTRRDALLEAIFPRIVAACAASGELSVEELRSFAVRDAIRGMRVIEPAVGAVRGILPNGALIVETARGNELFRSGSVVRAPEAG